MVGAFLKDVFIYTLICRYRVRNVGHQSPYSFGDFHLLTFSFLLLNIFYIYHFEYIYLCIFFKFIKMLVILIFVLVTSLIDLIKTPLSLQVDIAKLSSFSLNFITFIIW